MADVPAITLTDPQNEDGLPSPAQSPQTPRKTASFELKAGAPLGRPGSSNASEGGLSMSSPSTVLYAVTVFRCLLGKEEGWAGSFEGCGSG